MSGKAQPEFDEILSGYGALQHLIRLFMEANSVNYSQASQSANALVTRQKQKVVHEIQNRDGSITTIENLDGPGFRVTHTKKESE